MPWRSAGGLARLRSRPIHEGPIAPRLYADQGSMRTKALCGPRLYAEVSRLPVNDYPNRPLVGVGAVVVKGARVLLVRREIGRASCRERV